MSTQITIVCSCSQHELSKYAIKRKKKQLLFVRVDRNSAEGYGYGNDIQGFISCEETTGIGDCIDVVIITLTCPANCQSW